MALYPLFADLRKRVVLVVGGGEVAERKIAALLEAGARVHVVAPRLAPRLQEQCDAGDNIRHVGHAFAAAHLDDAWMVVAATADTAVNREVAAAAEARHILANVVDDAELSTFHCPARLQRGPIAVAVSSGGCAPALARRLRAELEVRVDPSWAALAALALRYRERIRARFRGQRARRQFYDWMVDGPVHALLRGGDASRAEDALVDALHGDARGVADAAGRVALVGAGPGDAGLLTLAAVRALQCADVILHDRLVGRGVLELARRDARRIDVGKRLGQDHAATQARIHRLLLEHAQRGESVVRLHGGDPLVFGRGGEELEFLRAHGIGHAVIPGITAAVASAAAAGVPLTDRRCASSVLFATAHRVQGWADADWARLAGGNATLALYMGVAGVDAVTRQLIKHGLPAATPFALVERASHDDERRFAGELRELPGLVRRNRVRAPALLLIGEVARGAYAVSPVRLTDFRGSQSEAVQARLPAEAPDPVTLPVRRVSA